MAEGMCTSSDSDTWEKRRCMAASVWSLLAVSDTNLRRADSEENTVYSCIAMYLSPSRY